MGDVMALLGALVSAVMTIISVYITVQSSDEQRRQDRHDEAYPYFAMEEVWHNRYPALLSPASRMDGIDSANHDEIEANGDYLIIASAAGSFQHRLTQTQREAADYRDKDITPEGGLLAYTRNPVLFVVLRLTNVGLGPAINSHCSLRRDEVADEPVERGRIRTVGKKSSFLLGIYVDTSDKHNYGDYDLVIRYEDIWQRVYLQSFVIQVHDEDGRPSVRYEYGSRVEEFETDKH